MLILSNEAVGICLFNAVKNQQSIKLLLFSKAQWIAENLIKAL